MITRTTRMLMRHRRHLKRLLPLGREVLLGLDEFKIYVRLDDWAVGARIAVRRTFEPHVVAALRASLRPGMRVIDLGANIGFHTLLAASRVGPTGHVAAFEPAPANAALLARSVAANRLSNVTLYPCAAAAAPAALDLIVDDSNGRLAPDGAPGARRVQAVALDQLLGPAYPVDLIKMDIEGAEGLALAGMAGIVGASRPTIISEFSPRSLSIVSGIEPTAFLGRLRELGYAVSVLDRALGESPRPESDAEVMAHFAHTASEHLDLIARPVERL